MNKRSKSPRCLSRCPNALIHRELERKKEKLLFLLTIVNQNQDFLITIWPFGLLLK